MTPNAGVKCGEISDFQYCTDGTHLRAPALKTEIFRKKSFVLVKRTSGLAKTPFSLFFLGFSVEGTGLARRLVARRGILGLQSKGSSMTSDTGNVW